MTFDLPAPARSGPSRPDVLTFSSRSLCVRRKLLDPGLGASCRHSMFLNLLYKSLKADVSLRRVKAFAKRLLHVSAGQSAGFACGALFLLSEVMKTKPGLKTLLQQDEVTRRYFLFTL